MSLPDELSWNDAGLVPAIVQDVHTGVVLMMAWMNAEAWRLTRDTGYAHFYSRSRGALWKKGETSGNTLAVREVRVDCDADTVLLLATPAGPACHTNAASCFFVNEGEDDDGPRPARAAILPRLERVLEDRKASDAGKSYTKSLFDAGFSKILEKIAEEHQELADELPGGEHRNVVHETADLLFHVMVGLSARGIAMDEVFTELERRFGTSGHEEKSGRG